jgi:hypothetical protein
MDCYHRAVHLLECFIPFEEFLNKKLVLVPNIPA